jgi:hypothetical protein
MTKPDPPANGPGSQPGKTRLITLPLKPEHHPVVLAEQARRASDIQLRIADWITAFAGSMNFVYLADHDFTEQELELKTNTQLTREIDRLTAEVHRRVVENAAATGRGTL